MLRRIYDWVLSWAESPLGGWALFCLACAESFFFPIPPDVLLIALCVAAHNKSFKYAAICSAGSLLGGVLGYLIGWQFMEVIGRSIIDLYGLADRVAYIQTLYRRYDAWAIGIAGFTPIPYKVFTITAGAFGIDFKVFFFISALSRSARFFMVAGFFALFGPGIKSFIDRYFNFLAIAFTLLLVAGAILIKWVL